MYFDKTEFRGWFSPKINMLNPTIPPNSLWDAVYILLYFLTVGILAVPMAVLSSTKLSKHERAARPSV